MYILVFLFVHSIQGKNKQIIKQTTGKRRGLWVPPSPGGGGAPCWPPAHPCCPSSVTRCSTRLSFGSLPWGTGSQVALCGWSSATHLTKQGSSVFWCICRLGARFSFVIFISYVPGSCIEKKRIICFVILYCGKFGVIEFAKSGLFLTTLKNFFLNLVNNTIPVIVASTSDTGFRGTAQCMDIFIPSSVHTPLSLVITCHRANSWQYHRLRAPL